MDGPREKASPCPRCGALNGASFDRCVRCAAPLGSMASGADALKGSVDARQLWGTKVLIGLTMLVFAGQLAAMRGALAKGQISKIILSGGSTADLLRFGAMLISIDDTAAEPFRLLSAVFVHIGALHIAMNMMGLGNIGRVAEPGVGSARFVNAYLVSGVVGFASNLIRVAIFPPRGPVPPLTAGASGAVFGAMGLILGWLVHNRDRRWRSFAVQAVFFAVILNFLGLNVNWEAHLAGLACGAAFGFYYASRPRPKSLLIANIGAIVGLLLSIVSLVLAQRAANWGRDPLRSLDVRLDAPPAVAPSIQAASPTPAGGANAVPPGLTSLTIRSGTRSVHGFDSPDEGAV